MTFVIRPEDLAIVQDILVQHLGPAVRVWVYGSRAGHGRPPRRGSDLDLLIDCGRPVEHALMDDIAEAFRESMLPYMVDLHDRHRTDDAFLARIAPDLVAFPIPEAATPG